MNTTTQIDSPAITETTTLQAVTTDRKPPGVIYPPWDGEWVEDETARNPYRIEGDVVWIRLTQNCVGVADVDDWPMLRRHRWFTKKSMGKPYWYAKLKDHTKKQGNRCIYAHAEIGQPGPNQVVDHIAGDTLDNRRSNLRPCSRHQNSLNSGKRKSNTSGYLGVCWRTDMKKWRAQLRIRGRHQMRSHHDDKVEAAMARDRMAMKLHGEFAVLNFPRETYAAELDA
jgi:hypothetical protein